MADVKRISLWAGPLFAVGVGVALWALDLEAKACLAAAVTALVAAWWVFEPIPLPATSLIPFVAFPLLGVLGAREVAAALGDDIIFLFLGGFVLSLAMEKSGTHRRVALGMVRLVGGGTNRRLVLGFMLASVTLSMWMSNTPTALMLLPVALAVIEQSSDRRIAVPLLLSVAYGVSIGGLGTPVGTPPNMIFASIYQKATGRQVGFLEWMRVAIPVVVVFTPLAWWWLTRGLRGRAELRLPELGAWRAEEVRVLVVFTLTAIAWVTRGQPDSGWGWSTVTLFTGATDATVAVAAALSLFLIGNGRGGRLMDWETAAKLPWGILLLFAGGIAIAKAFDASGLSKLIGDQLAGLGGWPLPAMLAVICVSVVFASELASNTAIATLLMPLLAAAAVGMGMEPRTLMIPAALAASLGFMLPVATPPNAIAFASGQVPVRTMVRNGFVLDLIGAAIITGVCYLLLV